MEAAGTHISSTLPVLKTLPNYGIIYHTAEWCFALHSMGLKQFDKCRTGNTLYTGSDIHCDLASLATEVQKHFTVIYPQSSTLLLASILHIYSTTHSE